MYATPPPTALYPSGGISALQETLRRVPGTLGSMYSHQPRKRSFSICASKTTKDGGYSGAIFLSPKVQLLVALQNPIQIITEQHGRRPSQKGDGNRCR